MEPQNVMSKRMESFSLLVNPFARINCTSLTEGENYFYEGCTLSGLINCYMWYHIWEYGNL